MEQNGERGQQEKGVVLAIKQEQQVGEGQQTVVNNQQVPRIPQKQCPRCNSVNTKFSYYNNHSPNQPRYHCKTCEREWTEGGSLRDIPIGGTSRKDKQPSKRDYSSADALSNMLSDAAKIVLNPTSSVKTKEPMTICAFPVAPIAHAPTYNSCSGFLSAVPTVPPSECLTSIGDFALSGGLNFHPDVLQQQQQRHLEQEQNRRQQMQQQRLLQQQQHRMQQMQQQWQLQQQLHRQQQLQQQRLLELQIQLLQQRQQELQQQQQLILHQQRQQELQPQHQQIQFLETSSSDTIENTVSQWFPENVPFTTSDLQEIFKDSNNVLGPEAVSRSGSNEIENKDINGSPMNPYYWPDFDPPPLS